MGFKCGIVGLPNVGKSTLFNALTLGHAAVENFPFCTIKPNIGIVSVDDIRLERLANIVNPKKIVKTCIEFVDIAGLVKGASHGEGLGNQFLNNIRDTHAIVHVVRCFKNDSIAHVYNQIQPVQDVDIINTELILSDFEICEKAIFQIDKNTNIKSIDKDQLLIILKKCFVHLKNLLMLKSLSLTKEEKKVIHYLRFLTLKPTVYIANVNEEDESFILLTQLIKMAKKENSIVIPIFANLELDSSSSLKNLNKKSWFQKFNISFSGLQDIVFAGYKLLNLITFFTVGKKEIRAWSIPKGSNNLEAAKTIHSDFSKGFIRAQIMSYLDFIQYKSEKKVKEMGKYRIEGKHYIVQDGDIIHFLFNI